MPETTPLIKAALNLRGGAGFDVYAFFMQNCNFSDKFVSETRLKMLILSAGMDACHQNTLS